MSCFNSKNLIITTKEGDIQEVTVPCGKCLGCYIDQSSEWSMRARLELRKHKESIFLTLTYNNEHLPEGGLLSRSDIQKFLKRLRRHLEPLRIRYYGCGEYGSAENTYRPHYHLIIYGYKPEDLTYFFTNDDGDRVYRSKTIDKIWGKGFVTVGEVTPASIRYCSLYLQKAFKELVKDKEVKPFRLYSTRPSLGYDGLTDEEIIADRVYISGKPRKLPRSYLRRFETNEWSEILPIIKERRAEKSAYIEENCIDPNYDPLQKLHLDKKKLDFYLMRWYNRHR